MYKKEKNFIIVLVFLLIMILIKEEIKKIRVLGEWREKKKPTKPEKKKQKEEKGKKARNGKSASICRWKWLIKVQDYWDRIESEGLIADKTVDIIDNGDGTYEVTTTPGYVFEITVEPNKRSSRKYNNRRVHRKR